MDHREKSPNEEAYSDGHLGDTLGRVELGTDEADEVDVELEIDDLPPSRFERLARSRVPQPPRWVTHILPRWTATDLQSPRSTAHGLPRGLQGRLSGPGALALLTALLLVVVVSGVAHSLVDSWTGLDFAGLGQPPASATWTALAARPPVASRTPRPQSQDGLACLQDASWSPDGRLVAVLGTRDDCSLGDRDMPEPGMVNLYRADEGRLTRQLALDALVAPALSRVPAALATPSPPPPGIGVGAVPVPIVDYQFVVWSPDGRHLAIPFAVHRELPGSRGVQDPLAFGLLLLNLPIGDGHVFLAPHAAVDTYGQGTWDLTTGQFITGDGAGGSSWVQALGYQWDSHGHLLPMTSLIQGQRPQPLLEDPPRPVGQPIGTESFSVWQSGFLVRADRGTTGIPPTFMFENYFPAWSPDGRYLTTVSAYGMLVPESQPLPTAKDLRPETGGTQPSYYILPVRDTGIAQALHTVAWSRSVAWSPNGQMLAVYPWDGSVVTLYSCRTGEEIAHFTVQRGAGLSGIPAHLLWSPDSARLALVDPEVGPLTRWQVPRL